MTQEYYKVLDNHNRSAWVGDIPQISVKYEIGKWSVPQIKGSQLFVFADLSVAKEWAYDYGYHNIYECEVKNPKKHGPYYCAVTIDYKFIFRLWQLYRNKKKYQYLSQHNLLPSIRWCDAVKLIKLIDKV